eukprot:gene7919-10749_t
MNRADQKVLIHQTNKGLLQIKSNELHYYNNLNIALGTQAAIIGGFVYGVFTQDKDHNGINHNYPAVVAKVVLDVFYVTSALTIAACVHVILTSMMLFVLGPGLALNGPLGSMAQATKFLNVEKDHVIISFILMIFFFQISTIVSFWVVMDLQSASLSSVAVIYVCYYWIYFCERIYLRFWWDKDEIMSMNDLSDDEEKEDVFNPVHEQNDNIGRVSTDSIKLSSNLDENIPQRKNKKSIFLGITKLLIKPKPIAKTVVLSPKYKRDSFNLNDLRGLIVHEGTIMKLSLSESMFKATYCTINCYGYMNFNQSQDICYKDQKLFVKNQGNDKNLSGIKLINYSLKYWNEIDEYLEDEMSDGIQLDKNLNCRVLFNPTDLQFRLQMREMNSQNGPEIDFTIIDDFTYSNDMEYITFQCDTLDELLLWLRAIKTASL